MSADLRLPLENRPEHHQAIMDAMIELRDSLEETYDLYNDLLEETNNFGDLYQREDAPTETQVHSGILTSAALDTLIGQSTPFFGNAIAGTRFMIEGHLTRELSEIDLIDLSSTYELSKNEFINGYKETLEAVAYFFNDETLNFNPLINVSVLNKIKEGLNALQEKGDELENKWAGVEASLRIAIAIDKAAETEMQQGKGPEHQGPAKGSEKNGPEHER